MAIGASSTSSHRLSSSTSFRNHFIRLRQCCFCWYLGRKGPDCTWGTIQWIIEFARSSLASLSSIDRYFRRAPIRHVKGEMRFISGLALYNSVRLRRVRSLSLSASNCSSWDETIESDNERELIDVVSDVTHSVLVRRSFNAAACPTSPPSKPRRETNEKSVSTAIKCGLIVQFSLL